MLQEKCLEFQKFEREIKTQIALSPRTSRFAELMLLLERLQTDFCCTQDQALMMSILIIIIADLLQSCNPNNN